MESRVGEKVVYLNHGGGIPGFNDDADALNVTVELVRRGYSEKDIDKIWSGNLLRVWQEVEKRQPGNKAGLLSAMPAGRRVSRG